MKRLIFGLAVVCLMAIVGCNNSKNDNPNIIGNYEGRIDGDEVNLSIYADSTYVQTIQNSALGEMQFNGKYRWSHDTIYLMDEYYIHGSKTIDCKDIDKDLPQEEKYRLLKLVSYDGKNLVLRDIRTQRVWEYRAKK